MGCSAAIYSLISPVAISAPCWPSGERPLIVEVFRKARRTQIVVTRQPGRSLGRFDSKVFGNSGGLDSPCVDQAGEFCGYNIVGSIGDGAQGRN